MSSSSIIMNSTTTTTTTTIVTNNNKKVVQFQVEEVSAIYYIREALDATQARELFYQPHEVKQFRKDYHAFKAQERHQANIERLNLLTEQARREGATKFLSPHVAYPLLSTPGAANNGPQRQQQRRRAPREQRGCARVA